MQARSAGLFVVVSVALVACGGGGASKAASPTTATTSSSSSPSESTSSASSRSLSSESIAPDSVCALVSLADVKAAIGADAVPTNSGPHCQWDASGDKRLNLDVSDFSTTGYASLDEYRADQTEPTRTKLASPADAFFDNAQAGIHFVKGDRFVDLEITLDANSGDFDPTSDKAAERAVLQPLADKLAGRL